MKTTAVMAFVTIMSFRQKIDAKLNVIPRHTTVKINDSTSINCSTSLQADQVQWRHGSNYVYTAIGIFETYSDRFSVEINASTGHCNLIIRTVQPSDSGIYECADDEGIGDRRSIQLIVLGDALICKSNIPSDGVIGPNDCDINPDVIQLSCSVAYHGDIPPVLQWKAIGGNRSLLDGISVSVKNNEVIYKLALNSTLDLNNASFICETTNALERQHYSCLYNITRIAYVFSSKVTINMTMNEEVSCFANTSQSCSYKWKWFRGDDSTTESDDQYLKPKKVGWHRCEATCALGKRSCAVEPLHAYVHVYSDTNSAAASGQSLLISLVLIVPLVVITTIVVIIYYRRKKQRKRQEEIQEAERLTEGLPDIYKSDPVFVLTVRPKFAKKEEREIRGLTILDKELFVVCKLNSSVEVYDLMEFTFSRQWNLTESIICAQDMASCIRNKCLYINGYKDRSQPSEILRVDPDGKLIKKWSTGDDWGWGLSVTPESNVILAVYLNYKLKEYSPEGQLMQEINLSSVESRISYPWHAIKLINGDFVVTHGHYDKDDLHRVCIVDAAGKSKQSSAERRGLVMGQMDRPVYLSVDENGFVLVVDRGNSRVLLLDPDLRFRRQILTKQGLNGLRDPWRILLDQTNDRIFVVDNELNKQRISIFNL